MLVEVSPDTETFQPKLAEFEEKITAKTKAVIVNTPYGPGSRGDGYLLRTEAVRRGVTCVTAMSAANTYVSAIEAVREDEQGHGSANDMGMDVIALQDLPQHTV